jgi:hypothetical protein
MTVLLLLELHPLRQLPKPQIPLGPIALGSNPK